jgi:hypothetical protein
MSKERESLLSARTYGRHGGAEDHEAQVAELHWPDGRVVQISGATEADEIRGLHVLIRVWPQNGTAENGGSNLTSLAIVLEAKGEDWAVTSLHIDKQLMPNV